MCVPDLQDAVQGSLVQRSSSLVHQPGPDYVHRVGGQGSRQAANKTGPGEGKQRRSRNELVEPVYSKNGTIFKIKNTQQTSAADAVRTIWPWLTSFTRF